MKIAFKLTFLTMILVMMTLCLQAQNIMVKGIVTDQNSEPIIGATVSAVGTKGMAVTNIDGKYSIQAPVNGTLQVNYVGMKTFTTKIAGRSEINIVLQDDVNLLQDVIVVGYGTQKRGSVTGAVAAVRGDEMIRTKNENPQNMLTGRVVGVRVWQKSSEPGSYNNSFDIRGMGAPLVIIDGVPRDMSDFQRMNANDIQDISVLKDASASIYGLRSANGVILITTKKGDIGHAKVQYNSSYTIQKPKSMPGLLDAFRTMDLYNERTMNNVNGGAPHLYRGFLQCFSKWDTSTD